MTEMVSLTRGGGANLPPPLVIKSHVDWDQSLCTDKLMAVDLNLADGAFISHQNKNHSKPTRGFKKSLWAQRINRNNLLRFFQKRATWGINCFSFAKARSRPKPSKHSSGLNHVDSFAPSAGVNQLLMLLAITLVGDVPTEGASRAL